MSIGSISSRIRSIRSSYWFVPTVMAILAALLGGAMIWLDVQLGSSWIQGVSWYQQIGVDGAREVLSTIAGSMITVAGVVFSITIVSLSYASGQYGPRVLTNFMTDRGNTVTLGTFVATFLYSLVVLRTIRGGDHEFVPQYAVIVAMILAVCSIGVLIYFIHHVLQSIHINNVVARIGNQLVSDTKVRFPRRIGSEGRTHDSPTWVSGDGERAEIVSHATGYIQSIDQDGIMALARERDLVIRLHRRPGDFIVGGRTLADVAPAGRWDDDAQGQMRDLFTVDSKRTPDADLMFLVSELVEIAARALSSGVNDPMTAITCLDWLGAGAAEFASRELPSPVRQDEDGVARVIAPANDFQFFIDRSFGRLRGYVAGDAVVAARLLEVIEELGDCCRLPGQVDVLHDQVSRFEEQAAGELHGPDDREIADQAAALREALRRKGELARASDAT